MVAMLDQAKHVEREEVASPTAEIMQEIQGCIQDLNNTQTVKTLAEKSTNHRNRIVGEFD